MWIKPLHDGWINSQHIESISARGTLDESVKDAPVLYNVVAITPFGNKIITNRMSCANAELTMDEIMRRFDTMTAYFNPAAWAESEAKANA